MYRLNDFFCGCGGIGLGFKEAGFNIVGSFDFDKYAVETYRKNVHPGVVQADIKEMTIDDVPEADVWAFGFPCQDLSVAGKQAGMEMECSVCGTKWKLEADSQVCPSCGGEDFQPTTRSGLFFEVMRLLDASEGTAKKPLILMAENVKALRPYLPVLEEQYKKRGYRTYYTLFNSKYWGVPQNRERYFVVGVREDIKEEFAFPEEQHDFVPKLSTVLEHDVAENFYIADEKAKSIISQALQRLEDLGKVHATLTPDRENKRQNGRRAKEDEESMFTLTAQDLHGVIQKSELVPEGEKYASALIHSRGLETRKDNVSHCVKGAEGGSSKNFVVERTDEAESGLHGVVVDDTYGYDGTRVYDGISPTVRSSRQGVKVIEGEEIVPAISSMQAHATVNNNLSPAVTTAAGMGGGQTVMVVEENKQDLREVCVNDRGFVGKPPQVSTVVPTLRAENHGNHPKVFEDAEDPAILRKSRNEYGKAIRKDYEAGRVTEQRSNMTDYEARPDGVSNTLTTVLKDNLLLEPQVFKDTAGQLTNTLFTDKDNCAYCCGATYYKGIGPSKVGKKLRTHIIERRCSMEADKETDVNIFNTDRYRVRKLTPTEYGRLQGFPMDSWEQVVSNSQAYKQFGNAVTVTVSNAIALSIIAFLDRVKGGTAID